MAVVQCKVCSKEFNVVPARLPTASFCSNKCAGAWRSVNQRGANHGRWKGGKDQRQCRECGTSFSVTPASLQKFCSKSCADKGGFRYNGESHPNHKPDSRRRHRRGKHGAWARAVLSRDKATCQECGARDVPLHAHHIKPFATFPALRWELSNGLTVCASCHWAIHSALNANGVNSGNILPGNAGDNPEPSFGRKPVEGVTTNGRAYRRWEGECGWCGAFIVKRWSDTAGKANLFCGKVCAGKYAAANRTYRPMKNPRAHGGNADTSAPRESDDIV